MEVVKDWRELFPYAQPTEAQAMMILNIIRSKPGSKLLIQNSTGGGKSIAALVGSLARDSGKKIVVFCRTVSQISSFLREWKKIIGDNKGEALNSIKANNSPKILPMVGKGKMCRMVEHTKNLPTEAVSALCHILPCSLHPSRNKKKSQMEKSIVDINVKLWYNSTLETYRRLVFLKNGHCPYYFQNSMVKTTDVLVTTYPYMSEPLFTYLRELLGVEKEDLILIFDEAHNLASTKKETINQDVLDELERLFGSLPLFEELKSAMGTLTGVHQFDQVCENFVWEEADQLLSSKRIGSDVDSLEKLVNPATIKFKEFLRIRKIGYLLLSGNTISAIRVAPNEWLKEFEGSNLQIYMSGTFRPLRIFKSLFGFTSGTHSLDLDTNYDRNQLKGFLSYNGITSMIGRRGEMMYKTMVEIILQLYEDSPRHVLLVAPSYRMLDSLVEILDGMIQGRGLHIQVLKETKQTKLTDIQRVVMVHRKKLIIAGVSSGKLTEGVELVRNGKSLISLVIYAGLPFKVPEDGKDDIYFIINKLIGKVSSQNEYLYVLILQALVQAMGRTVRSGIDKGAIIILDFRGEKLQKLDPGFNLKRYGDMDSISDDLSLFFRGYQSVEMIMNED